MEQYFFKKNEDLIVSTEALDMHSYRRTAFAKEGCFCFGVTATIEAKSEGEAIEKLKMMIEENSLDCGAYEKDYDCKSIHTRNVEFKECHYIVEEK
jgi:hypothetical protein